MAANCQVVQLALFGQHRQAGLKKEESYIADHGVGWAIGTGRRRTIWWSSRLNLDA